jgi:hypothetical protein
MAHGRGDLVAAEHGRIEVEYYQLIPVLAALRQPRVRLMIADDVGLGKTIEAGLILLELARRGRADRVLIACPAGLVDQWVEEMGFRFNPAFEKVDSRRWLELRRDNPASVSPWAAAPLAVSSIDYLKANLAAGSLCSRRPRTTATRSPSPARSNRWARTPPTTPPRPRRCPPPRHPPVNGDVSRDGRLPERPSLHRRPAPTTLGFVTCSLPYVHRTQNSEHAIDLARRLNIGHRLSPGWIVMAVGNSVPKLTQVVEQGGQGLGKNLLPRQTR